MYNHEPANYECPFCLLVEGQKTEYNKQSDIVYCDERVMAFVSPQWWINNPGNVIVIPLKHYENVYDIPEKLLSAVNIAGKKIALAIKEAYQCDGISFRQHNEPGGDQDVWHYHLHVFPRWKGDNLYQNHDKKSWVTDEERLNYVRKIKMTMQKE